MSFTLFEILTSKYADGHLIDRENSEKQIDLSILSHLSRLLNARQGSLSHLPDYGLPDMAEIYLGLPYSLNILINEIKRTIEKYEPRLKNINIVQKLSNQVEGILYLEIQANISNGRRIVFDSYFLKTGMSVTQNHSEIP